MAVLNRDEFFDSVSKIVGDRNDDESLKFIEDATDTYRALEGRNSETIKEEYEKKLKETEDTWRARYKERFFSAKGGDYFDESEKTEENKIDEEITIDDLFRNEE